MLRLVPVYRPPVKVSPSSELQPKVLCVTEFSRLAGESRHSSQTVVAAGTITANPFKWFFPKTGFLKCLCQGHSAELPRVTLFISAVFSLWSPRSSAFWPVSTMIFLDCQLWLLNSGVKELGWVTPALHMDCNSLKAARWDSYWFLVSQDHWPLPPEI